MHPFRTNNPVLLHFLLYLSGHLGNATAQDIVSKTLSSCPDLFITYVRSLALNFEPQPTPKWFTDMAFITKASAYTRTHTHTHTHFSIFFLCQVYGSFPPVLQILSSPKESTAPPTPLELVGVALDLTAPLPVTRGHLTVGLQVSLILFLVKRGFVVVVMSLVHLLRGDILVCRFDTPYPP